MCLLCGCASERRGSKYIVQEDLPFVIDLDSKLPSGYQFRVAQDLGEDSQGGHYFKPIAYFTVQKFAETAARQMNQYGVLYFSGTELH